MVEERAGMVILVDSAAKIVSSLCDMRPVLKVAAAGAALETATLFAVENPTLLVGEERVNP